MQSVGASIQSGGTGYTLNDVVTISGGTPVTVAATFTVTGVTGGVVTAVTALNFAPYTVLPTAPVSTTGGTGTGLTLTNLTWVIGANFTITNAGSGYVEQPTVSFSGGGGSGAAAYAQVGATTIIKGLGPALDFYTPNTSSSPAFRVSDYSGSAATGYWSAYGGNASPILRAVGATSGSIQTGSAVPIQFITNATTAGAEQLRVSHTASAVNYVQVTGAATTARPIISAQGSDTNISLGYDSKGTGTHVFRTNGVIQFQALHTASAANYATATGAAAGAAPVFGVSGTDTNIDLTLTPKGTGVVKVTTGTGLGYGTGIGSAVTQATSRTTGVTINTPTGAITLVSAAGNPEDVAGYNTITVTNSSVVATDVVIVSQKSGTDKYIILVTAVATGSFNITYATTGGITVEQPVFNFAIIKGVTA
jgi:hypothetical protein